MSTTTENLGLFKYDTTSDASTAFSIDQALNDNWDKIDIFAETALSMQGALGDNGFVKFSTGLIMNYGYASTSSQEVNFAQPVLSSNGSMGGTRFAVAAEKERYSNNGLTYNAFDNNDSTYEFLTAGNNWIKWYNPTPIKCTKVYVKCDKTMSSLSLSASNDNSNWTALTISPSQVSTGNITVTNTNFYKYYRLNYYVAGSASAAVYTIKVTATYITEATNTIVYPYAHTSDDYSYSLSYFGGIMGNSYANSLTSTGMTLFENSNASKVCYMTMGY